MQAGEHPASCLLITIARPQKRASKRAELLLRLGAQLQLGSNCRGDFRVCDLGAYCERKIHGGERTKRTLAFPLGKQLAAGGGQEGRNGGHAPDSC